MPNDTPARSPFSGEDPVPRPAGFDPQPYLPPPSAAPVAKRKFQYKLWKHILLFLLTGVTTTAVGVTYYVSFVSGLGQRSLPADLTLGPLLLGGLWYSLAVLAILTAHEMGHYLFCRRYNVDATLPYFIPAPGLFGTFGAVIRIREPFPTRTVLFDIGVAGPIGGFIVLLPILLWGMSLSEIVRAPTEGSGFTFGEPLLFQWAARLIVGPLAEGQALNVHPMVFGAWLGMLATAINLLPFGQLDGGHISYATIGRWATPLSLLTVAVAVVMALNSHGWILMTALMVLMLVFLGPRHPRVLYEYEPLGRGRRLIAVIALLLLILCFTPVLVEPYELIRAR